MRDCRALRVFCAHAHVGIILILGVQLEAAKVNTNRVVIHLGQ